MGVRVLTVGGEVRAGLNMVELVGPFTLFAQYVHTTAFEELALGQNA